MEAPPSYPLGSVAACQLDISQPLPDYARTVSAQWDIPAADRLHHFHLTRKMGEQWLTLTVTSRAATADTTPTVFQGGNIAGSLKLYLEKEELVDEISIDVSVVTPHVWLRPFLNNPSNASRIPAPRLCLTARVIRLICVIVVRPSHDLLTLCVQLPPHVPDHLLRRRQTSGWPRILNSHH